MDFSSLTETQKQQLQQIQTQYQEHQAQQQQQKQHDEATAAAAAQQYQQQQAYDPSSQAQSYYPSSSQPQSSYDQSYSSSYYQQYQDPQQQSQQYAAYYNNSEYSNSYQPQQQPQYSQAETVQYHPPAVSQPQQAQVIEHRAEGVSLGVGGGQGQAQHQHQQQLHQNAYYSNASSGGSQVGHGGDQSNSGYNVTTTNGFNAAAAAAAVAALSQLTQYAGSMGAQDRQWYGNGGGYGPPMGDHYMGPSHYGPPVGRYPYRGGGRRGGGPFRGGRGNFGHHSPNTGGSGPPFRGRGRGRGRGNRQYPPHGASSSSLPEGTSAEGAGEPSVDANSEAVRADMGNQQPIRIAWCELCRVDCTSLEILEQHKNGKRHKKNLQRLEDMKNSCEPTTEVQNNEKITADSSAEVPDSVPQGEGEKPENILTEVGTDQNLVENEVDDNEEAKSERQGMKRKMRGGRGGKRVKTFGGPSRRSLGPPKPKVVIPLICDLCNVKCDTQEVFDRHVGGKKHLSKLKRFEGHQAMYGPTGVQALYPPNPIAQALSRPQGPQQAFHGPPQGSYPPVEAYIPPQAQNPNPQLSDAPLEFSNQNNVPQGQQPSASVEPETKQMSSA